MRSRALVRSFIYPPSFIDPPPYPSPRRGRGEHLRDRPRIIIAALIFLTAFTRTAGAGEVIERILAVVQDRPVLLSEVRVVQEVRGLSGEQALELLVDERLMFEQAARLPQSVVSEAEVDPEVAKLLATHPALAGRVAEADLRRLVRRQAAILKFVEFRFRPQVRVAEDLPPERRDEEVRRALGQRIEAWIKELRAQAEVRYNK
jgi:hypothetical protein